MNDTLRRAARAWLSDIRWFSRLVVRRPLHRYQIEPAQAIVDSVIHKRGLEFAVLFPRQTGKNEIQAQLQAYLLNVFQRVPGAQIVAAAPTYRPQSQNAKRRLESVLNNDWNQAHWRSRDGHVVQLGEAAVQFLSAGPGANVVGATASLLLMCDEAQHVEEALWLERFVPMAASGQATLAYFGTAWTGRTLLARTISHLRALEAGDGKRRVFIVGPEAVAEENPAYGDFVRRQALRLGRTHPLIRTQYFNETIEADGGMFPPARRALMQGDHPRLLRPAPGRVYALLLDVAGEDEGVLVSASEAGLLSALKNPRRDSTALTVVEVDTSTVNDMLRQAPTYRAVDRREWIGVKHTALYGELMALVEHWHARFLVADATGVGAGLVSFLSRALAPGTVIPFEFNSSTKSQLGWDFLAICDTGRWKEYDSQPSAAHNGIINGGRRSPQSGASGYIRFRIDELGFGNPLLMPNSSEAVVGGHELEDVQVKFFQQVEHCQYEIMPGPGKLMRWGVPDGTRDSLNGEAVHDDLLISAALCAALDRLPWRAAPAGPLPADPAEVDPDQPLEIAYYEAGGLRVLLLVQRRSANVSPQAGLVADHTPATIENPGLVSGRPSAVGGHVSAVVGRPSAVILDELSGRLRPEEIAGELLTHALKHEWPRPELAIGDPGALETRRAFRALNIATRGEAPPPASTGGPDPAGDTLQRLLASGRITLHPRCQRLTAELQTGGPHAEALKVYVWNRMRR